MIPPPPRNTPLYPGAGSDAPYSAATYDVETVVVEGSSYRERDSSSGPNYMGVGPSSSRSYSSPEGHGYRMVSSCMGSGDASAGPGSANSEDCLDASLDTDAGDANRENSKGGIRAKISA